ncbi:tRNA (adenosine(37)-N6)-threonylcarbamoyltransferase complex dimerization subunit type 1 TsaB [Propionicicella superfundia]|uniref:tRNA (adenosine(37)-N6)-threonylcarbamoyltransferase complex dimerization subunit type 1 TsaB n=1 Tax=Propionicicella superfundia TaxID=348582 RepID=UPI00041FD5FD|nr:tRNA (adenosine(37)-N6)-threonylcarbamoyltransferase complex dimerization subunit type 1 TsaB [Propionicicella superfundia]
MSGIVLGIDTATSVSAGVAAAGRVLATRTLEGDRNHVEQLQPTIDAVIAEAGISLSDLTGVAVGMGPGPFTGLRVGIVTAQVLAEALGVPLHRVCTLDVLAAQWERPPADFVVVTDARRREVYWARYRDGERVDGPNVTSPGLVPAGPGAGPGAGLCAQVESSPGAPGAVSGGVLAARASELPDPGAVPLYLRRPDATVSTRRKSVLVVPGRRS